MLVEYVLSDEVRTLELLTAERTQPFVFRQLLSICQNKLFNFGVCVLGE